MNNKNLQIKQILTLAFENHKKSNFKLAESLYKKILKIDPNHIDSISLLGTLFLQEKFFDKGIELFNKALEINPNHVNALHNLGYAFIETGKTKEAEKLFLKVIEIQPKHTDAHYNLGNVYRRLGELYESKRFYEKAIQIQPENPRAYNNLGNIFKFIGNFEEAINSYNKAIQIQPNHPNAYHNLGNAYKQLGQFKKALEFYRKGYQLNPGNLETLFTISELNKEILDLNLKKKLIKLRKNKYVTKHNIAYANFLLSKYELEERNFEKEFNYLLEGHSNYFDFKKISFNKGVDYWLNEVPKNEELMKISKSTQNKLNYEKEIKPIFIIGVPRCGSTLVEKVIASGSANIPIGEETAIISFFVGEKIVAKESFNLDFEILKKKIINRYEQRKLLKKKYNYVFTDKSLDNFFFIDLIKTLFPRAKVINCRRNILASIISILKNNLGDVSWAHNLKHIFQYFDIYHKKIDEFKKMHPNFIYELSFEKFINDPNGESKKLMKFCDLPWDKKCLEYYKRKDLISRTASNVQIRKAIYKDSPAKHLPYKQLLNRYGRKYSWFN